MLPIILTSKLFIMKRFISVAIGIKKDIPKVAIKSLGKSEFLNRYFIISLVLLMFMSTSISAAYAEDNIRGLVNTNVGTTRQEVMTRIDEISRTIKKDLPEEISKGIRWTDFSYTKKGNLGVPAIIFTYKFDMKTIYGSECPEELLPGWLGAYAEKASLLTSCFDERRLPWYL